MAKLKSMFTIFEKVKSGTINTVTTRKFSGVNYFKKNELIKPYLHSIDETILDKNISITFMNSQNISSNIDAEINQFNSERNDKINVLEFKNSMKEIYLKFPKEIQRDIFNQYYTVNHKLKYEDREVFNKNKFKFLDRANESVLKVITNDNHVKSMVFCKNIMQYYMYILAKLKYTDKKAFEETMNNLNNKSEQKKDNNNSKQNQQESQEQQKNNKDDKQDEQNNENLSNNINGATNENSLEKLIETDEHLLNNLINEAKETVNNIDQVMSKEEIEEEWNKMLYNITDSNKFNPKELEQIKSKLKEISCNSTSIKPFVKKILDKSISYFKGKEKYVYDEFINNPIASELIEFEMLHPKFKNLFIEDLQIRDVKKLGKINIYIDISGSMSNIILDKVSRIDFCKALVFKLKEMDILKSVYTFNSKVKQLKNNDVNNILFIEPTGGTSLSNVIKHAIKEDENCIVITDAEDYINEYSEKVYFVGIGNPRFRANSSIMESYLNNKQLISFDGQDIYNIGINGTAVK
jgi:hypothetical protein